MYELNRWHQRLVVISRHGDHNIGVSQNRMPNLFGNPITFPCFAINLEGFKYSL